MKDSDKKILLVIAAIAILVAVYFLVVSPTRDEIKAIKETNAQLETRLADLIAKEAQKDVLLQETEEAKAKFQEVLKDYPADLAQEVTVMFLKQTELDNEFINKVASLPRETQYYVLAGSASDNSEAVTTESEAAEAEDEGYVVSTIPYEISYTGTYEGLKDYMQYIADYKYRMNISEISISFDPELEVCNGALILNGYGISGPGREGDKVTVDVQEGKNNIFASLGGVSTKTSSAYAADNGQAIVSNHNIEMLLTNANNDSTSGIIVATNINKEDSYVTSTANEAVGLNINVYSEDGKNFVKYAIGSKSYTEEITSKDVTIYVKSSKRVDDDDKNQVLVTLDNTSGLSVYFKVVDDDATSPRFKIESKTGVSVVYD
jgi:Tfp pilus assembly protein PilO